MDGSLHLRDDSLLQTQCYGRRAADPPDLFGLVPSGACRPEAGLKVSFLNADSDVNHRTGLASNELFGNDEFDRREALGASGVDAMTNADKLVTELCGESLCAPITSGDLLDDSEAGKRVFGLHLDRGCCNASSREA